MSNMAENKSILFSRPKICAICSIHLSQESWTVLILAGALLLEEIAYNPLESLQSSLNSNSGLGTLSLACLYGPFFLFAIGAPAIVRAFTPKWTIVIAWSFLGVYFGANFYPTWYTLIPASVLAGSMLGPLLTSKDLYISQMAKRSADKSIQNGNPSTQVYQTKLSFYNGITFGAIAMGGTLGQLISSVVLSQAPHQPTFEESCGAFHCATDVAPRRTNLTNGTTHGIFKPETSLVYTILAVFTSFLFLAILLIAVGLRQISIGKIDQSVKATVLSCAIRFTDCRMLLIVPQMMLFGFSHGIVLSDYTRSYVTCGKGVAMLGYIFISKDICSTVASIAFGRLVKYTGRQIQVVLALAGYAGLYCMMWFWEPAPGDHVAMYFVVTALFGISDVVFQNHICTILAMMFDEDKAAAFANFHSFRALSKSLSFGLSGFFCIWVKLTIVSVVFVLACLSFVLLEMCAIYKKPKTTKEDMAIEIEVMLPKDGFQNKS